MRIAPETIEAINQRADILEIVQDFVSIKKKGRNWMACCPFHNEKTPSFSVSPNKGIYKCFGCGRGGDSISFIMELESYSYVEALQYLAKRYNIPLKTEENLSEEEVAIQKERESLYIVLDFAKAFFQGQMKETEDGKALALSYFKERGFREKTLDSFELGYAPDNWSALYEAAKQQGFSEDILEKAGLIIRKDDKKVFDRFRNRVTFPIHNVSGKVIAFGARILKKDAKQAKYLNSPETPVYHKSRILYGISQARKKIREEDNCYLVEGYTDVISLHQAEIENVVASSGTSLTEDQARLIRRYTENVTVLYDGDAAGIKASLRGVDLILEQGLNVRVVVFPDSQDPDSYVNELGGTRFKQYLKENAKDFIRFKAELYQEEAKNDPLKRAALIKEVVDSIMKIPDAIKQRVFFQECAQLFKIDEQSLIDQGNQVLSKQKKNNSFSKPPEVKSPEAEESKTAVEEQTLSPTYTQEKAILRLLVLYAGEKPEEISTSLGHYILKSLEKNSFQDESLKRILADLKKLINTSKSLSPKNIIQNINPAHKSFLVNLIEQRYEISDTWREKYFIEIPREEENLLRVADEHILRLKWYHIQGLIRENEKKLLQAKSNAEQDKAMKVAMKLKELEKGLAGKLNNILRADF